MELTPLAADLHLSMEGRQTSNEVSYRRPSQASRVSTKGKR